MTDELALNRKLRKESMSLSIELLDMGYSQNDMLEEMNNKMREMIKDHKLLEG